MSKAFLLLTAILFFAAMTPDWCCADQSRSFELQHRSVEELIPLLTPLADPETRIGGEGQRLVIRGSQDDIATLAGILKEFDRQIAQFVIQVRQSRQTQQLQRQGRQLSTAGNKNAATLSTGSGLTLSNNQQAVTQTLRIAEGQRGFLQIGRDEPFSRGMRMLAGDIFGFGENIEYREVTTGFWVSPELRGTRLRLQLTPQMSTLDSAARQKTVEFQQSSTVVEIPLGRWVNLSTSASEQSQAGRAMLTYKTGGKDELREIWVKADQHLEEP